MYYSFLLCRYSFERIGDHFEASVVLKQVRVHQRLHTPVRLYLHISGGPRMYTYTILCGGGVGGGEVAPEPVPSYPTGEVCCQTSTPLAHNLQS